ncbi:transmembrane protein 33 [Entomortierella parvispora]|uniref:Transmembrane protein 33 n=1 Tax=Entomortierella parvispora TaxID=205924 RepID=A0A9P3M166_9FUNG|nr:transmembrane protein 33 [Entomortierella parvispora]
MPAAATTPKPANTLLTLIKGPQFVWWLGHVILLFCTAMYLPYWLTFNYKAGAHWYTRAFVGALISYGVVVYKSFPEFKFDAQFLQSVIVEENVQYFLMAIFWWRSTPMLAPLIPYVVFAFFNALNYTRTNLLPAFMPGNASAGIARQIQTWTEKNHGPAMALVAIIEVIGVMGSLILGAITFQSSFLSPIVYANFLRFRYFFNTHTRSAFALIRARLDALILPPTGNPKIPPKVVQAYTLLQGAVTRFGMAAVQQPGANGAAPAQ